MLRRHIFKKITGTPLGNVCLRECYRDVRCQSFNYVISKETCELSNRTKEARPEDFVPNSDRYYFKRDMNRGKINVTETTNSSTTYIYLNLFFFNQFAEYGYLIAFLWNTVWKTFKSN